ncbi:hypothetical protein [Cylindrospermopsis raciborskii]|nr:hypothetical protein [Cylindrospermopsis raciborskii]
MDTLVIECYAHYVHLATAGEIAVSEYYRGEDVGFVFIHSNNPDNPFFSRDFLKRISYNLRGTSCRNLVSKLERKLLKVGIKVCRDNYLERSLLDNIKEFSLNFPNNLEELKNCSYQGAKLGLATASSLISCTRHSNPNIEDYRQLVELYLHESAVVFEKSRITLEKLNPRKVISFNGRFACSSAIFQAALQLGIMVQYHERGATFDRYEIFDEMPHKFSYIRDKIRRFWADCYLSYHDKLHLAHRFFQIKREGYGVGWYSFVDKQEKGLVPTGTTKNKIVYFSSSDDEFAAVGDFYTKHIFDDQKQAINTLISWVSKQENSVLVVRVHPHVQQKHPEDQKYWSSLSGEKVTLITSESPIDSYALIDWSDIVVTYGSTVGIEATYWGKPSILIGDALYSGFGCVYEPKSLNELFELLDPLNRPSNLDQETCLPYGLYFMSFGKSYKYYKPENLFTGEFLGDKLTFYPEWVDALRPLKTLLKGKLRNFSKRKT